MKRFARLALIGVVPFITVVLPACPGGQPTVVNQTINGGSHNSVVPEGMMSAVAGALDQTQP